MACPDCERNGSWRSVACSPECYIAYVDAVTAIRESESQSKQVEVITEEVVSENKAIELVEIEDTGEIEELTEKKSKRK